MSPDGDPPAAGEPDGWQPVRHTAPALLVGEIVRLGGALLLLVAMVALRWYGAAGAGGLERSGPSRALGAWPSMTVGRWLMVATIGLTLAAAGPRALGRGRRLGARTAGALAMIGGATALLLVYRVLISPPLPDRVLDVKLGAVLGLIGALAIAGGSWESWRSLAAGPRSAAEDPFPPPRAGVG